MTRRLVLGLTFLSAIGLDAAPPASMQRGGGKAPDPAVVRGFTMQAENELRNDILPFWLRHTRDRERGGFFGEISNDLVINKDAPRGALLTTRVLWTFSAAYRRYHDPDYLEMARRAYADLLARFWDEKDGGLFWSVTAAGRPLNPGKILYVQAFGIYGLSEYYRATHDPTVLEHAVALYRTVEAHCRDEAHGGYFEEFTRDWTLERNLRRSVMGSQALKSQNTHLHLMEAYTNLLRAWPDSGLQRNLRALVEIMLTRILNPVNHHLWLFLDADWTPKSDHFSFGHDIEVTRLLPEAAEVLGDPALVARAKTAALATARVTLAEGLDADGGLLSEADPRGLTNTTKEWWQQAEAATGFLNAYLLSGDPRFFQASRQSWNFITTHLVDRKHGEWYRAVLRDGRVPPHEPKVSLWKCPYHNSRACMELVDLLRQIGGPDRPE